MAFNLFWEIWYYGPEIIRFSNSFDKLEGSEFAELVAEKQENIQSYFKNYDVVIDKKIFIKLVDMYVSSLPRKFKARN